MFCCVLVAGGFFPHFFGGFGRQKTALCFAVKRLFFFLGGGGGSIFVTGGGWGCIVVQKNHNPSLKTQKLPIETD